MTETYKKQLFRISLLLCVTALLLALYLGYSYEHTPDKMLEDATEDAKRQADTAAREINAKLGKLPAISESIANDLSNGALKNDQVVERLKETMEEHPELFGVAVAYKPYEYESKRRLYAPYYVRKQGELQLSYR